MENRHRLQLIHAQFPKRLNLLPQLVNLPPSHESPAAPRIAPNECLFCPSSHADMPACLAHMQKAHSFSIPYVQHCEDCEGASERARGLFDLSSRQNGNCISSKTLIHDRRPSQLSCGKDCNWRHVYPGQTLAFAAMLSLTQLHLTRVAEPSATKALDTSTLFAPTCATRTT